MKSKLLFLSLLLFPMVGHAWCESSADCPAGYYCSKHSVYVGNYCQRIYGGVETEESPKRCWWNDKDCDPGQHCVQKSEYIPGYCV